MKKRKIALWTALLLIAASGCGNKMEQLVESVDVGVEPINETKLEEDKGNDVDAAQKDISKEIEENTQKNQASLNNEESASKESSQDKEASSQNEKPSSEEVLEGSVTSINEKDNFVIINKIFTEELENGASEAVMLTGSDAEELITVYFTENTKFRIKTVVNAGEEVTEKEGTFSDIKMESTLEFKGKMDSKGEEFLADEAVIYEFIYK
ncbi:MAG: hypothetical protein NC400_13905 [Clostridium sp.]|nr:hypothetical protein [Clostridium sp.]